MDDAGPERRARNRCLRRMGWRPSLAAFGVRGGAFCEIQVSYSPSTNEFIRYVNLNRNNKHWYRSNHGDHGASRGKAITIVIPVSPWLNLCANVVWSDVVANLFVTTRIFPDEFVD